MTKSLKPKRKYQPPTKPAGRANGLKMQFFIIETQDYRFHVRIWRRLQTVCDQIVDTLEEAQALINKHIQRSMV